MKQEIELCKFIMLQNQKGYVRQVDKNKLDYTLIRLRKEFILVNYDYYDYCVLLKAEPDDEFENRMEKLIKLQRSNRIYISFNFDESQMQLTYKSLKHKYIENIPN